jgi:hypothetical protein
MRLVGRHVLEWSRLRRAGTMFFRDRATQFSLESSASLHALRGSWDKLVKTRARGRRTNNSKMLFAPPLRNALIHINIFLSFGRDFRSDSTAVSVIFLQLP